MIESALPEYAEALKRLKVNSKLGPKIAMLDSKAHIYLSARQVAKVDHYFAAKVGNPGGQGSGTEILLGHSHCTLEAFEIFFNLPSDRSFLWKTFGIDTTLDNVLAHELGHIYSLLQGVTGAAAAAEAIYWENQTRTGPKRLYHN